MRRSCACAKSQLRRRHADGAHRRSRCPQRRRSRGVAFRAPAARAQDRPSARPFRRLQRKNAEGVRAGERLRGRLRRLWRRRQSPLPDEGGPYDLVILPGPALARAISSGELRKIEKGESPTHGGSRPRSRRSSYPTTPAALIRSPGAGRRRAFSMMRKRRRGCSAGCRIPGLRRSRPTSPASSRPAAWRFPTRATRCSSPPGGLSASIRPTCASAT